MVNALHTDLLWMNLIGPFKQEKKQQQQQQQQQPQQNNMQKEFSSFLGPAFISRLASETQV
jgi:hypothetical protein